MSKTALFLLLAVATIGCKNNSAMQSEDAKYVNTAVDLIRTRATISASKDTLRMDSTHVLSALDSVYKRHATTRQQFIDWTLRLSEDPKKANAFFDAVNDSIKKTP